MSYLPQRVRRVNVHTLSQAKALQGAMAPSPHINYVVPDSQYKKFLRYIAYAVQNQLPMAGPMTAVNLNSFGIDEGVEDYSQQRSLHLRGYNVLSVDRNQIMVKGDSTMCPFLPGIKEATDFFTIVETARNHFTHNSLTAEKFKELIINTIKKQMEEPSGSAFNLTDVYFSDIQHKEYNAPSVRLTPTKSKLTQVGFSILPTVTKLAKNIVPDVEYSSDMLKTLFDNCFAQRK